MSSGYPPDPPLPAPSEPDQGDVFVPGTPEYERVQAALGGPQNATTRN